MKKKYAYLILICLCWTSVFSQPTQDSVKTTNSYASVTSLKKIILGQQTGFEWEQKISRTSTLGIFFGGAFGFVSNEVGLGALQENFAFFPAASAAYKKYYNLQKRANSGKKVNNNTGNFFLFKVDFYFPVENWYYKNLLISQGWGIQRPLGKRINFELQLGITEHFLLSDQPPGEPYFKIHPISTVLSVSYLL
jgi:hypothetical protein